MQLGVIVPVLGGMCATVLGVMLGAILTRRTQVQHWLRDREVDACLGIMRESNRVQFALRAAWRSGTKPDWVPWNEALTVLTLVTRRELVLAAQQIDHVVWESSQEISAQRITSEEEWALVRSAIEEARLAFINLARRQLADRREPVSRLAARPALPSGRQRGETEEGKESAQP